MDKKNLGRVILLGGAIISGFGCLLLPLPFWAGAMAYIGVGMPILYLIETNE